MFFKGFRLEGTSKLEVMKLLLWKIALCSPASLLFGIEQVVLFLKLFHWKQLPGAIENYSEQWDWTKDPFHLSNWLGPKSKVHQPLAVFIWAPDSCRFYYSHSLSILRLRLLPSLLCAVTLVIGLALVCWRGCLFAYTQSPWPSALQSRSWIHSHFE